MNETHGEMSNEVEEEIAFGHADHFIENLHEQTETFARLQFQSIGDISAEIFRPGRRIHFECFGCVVGKVNFMIDLCRHVLNSFYFHLMWRMFALTISKRFSFRNEDRQIKAKRFTSMFVGDVRNNQPRVDVYASGERDSLLSEGQHSERNNHWPTTSIPNHEIHSPGCHFLLTV